MIKIYKLVFYANYIAFLKMLYFLTSKKFCLKIQYWLTKKWQFTSQKDLEEREQGKSQLRRKWGSEFMKAKNIFFTIREQEDMHDGQENHNEIESIET